MPLAPYDGKGDLKAHLAQFNHMCMGNGWSMDEDGTLLLATLHPMAAEVLITMPPGAITLSELSSPLNSGFGKEQQIELVQTQLISRKQKPNETIGELAYDIHHAVVITHVNMAASSQKGLTLDHFLQVSRVQT